MIRGFRNSPAAPMPNDAKQARAALLSHWLGVMEAIVIDDESAVTVIGIDFQGPLVELDVASRCQLE